MKQLSFIGALVCMVIAGAAHAQTRSYAVVSLVGDKLDVVTYQMATGSSVDRNVHEPLPVTDGYFDDAALLASEKALARIDAKAKISLFAASSPSWYADQARFFDGTKAVLPADLTAALRTEGATHLLLITKYRGDARLQAYRTKLGSGKLEGLGFYIDHSMKMITRDTLKRSVGFLAAYSYVRLSLIDLASSTVMRSQTTIASRLNSTARGEGFDPWQAMTPGEKLMNVRELLEGEIARLVPEVVVLP